VEKYGRVGQATDNIIRRMCMACWITKATYTDSKYVILVAFPWQQWLRERAAMLRSYVHFLGYYSARTKASTTANELYLHARGLPQ
jgi:hypothetical protein